MRYRKFTVRSGWQANNLLECETVSVCERIIPTTCTVLGYPVSRRSKLWKVLDWKSVWIDGRNGVRHLLDARGAEYLHVSTVEEAQYRVRPKLEIGDKVLVRIGKEYEWGEIVDIIVHGFSEGFWHWRYEVRKPKK